MQMKSRPTSIDYENLCYGDCVYFLNTKTTRISKVEQPTFGNSDVYHVGKKNREYKSDSTRFFAFPQLSGSVKDFNQISDFSKLCYILRYYVPFPIKEKQHYACQPCIILFKR